jgi:hypothetical protein
MPLLLVDGEMSRKASKKKFVSIVALKEASEIVALCPTPPLSTATLTRKLRNRVVPLHAACILLGRSFRA